jgi:hypothetical protein
MHVDIVDDCDQDICGILEDSSAGCMGPKQNTWPNIEGVQYIGGPLQVKNWGVRTPATPTALTPMSKAGFGQQQYENSFNQ